MTRLNRLFDLTQILRDGQTHRAEDLAKATGVTARTIYRDMATLAASGIAVEGTRGTGYRMAALTALPGLALSDAELEALHLGLAITGEAADPDLRAAAVSLAAKIDAALPQEAATDTQAWAFATYPFADTARGITHMPTLRAAINTRQKIRLIYTGPNGTVTSRVVRPLKLDHHARIWTLTGWCELRAGFRVFRVDLIETAEALPELFRDEVGKMLADHHL